MELGTGFHGQLSSKDTGLSYVAGSGVPQPPSPFSPAPSPLEQMHVENQLVGLKKQGRAKGAKLTVLMGSSLTLASLTSGSD